MKTREENEFVYAGSRGKKKIIGKFYHVGGRKIEFYERNQQSCEEMRRGLKRQMNCFERENIENRIFVSKS